MASGCEVEIKLPEDCKAEKKEETKDTRLESFSMCTKHLPDVKSWEAGQKYTITLDVLFTGLRRSYREDDEQEAEMLILPKKPTEKSKS